MAATVGILAITDTLLPVKEETSALVTGKQKNFRGKQGNDYFVRARNQTKEYNESISLMLYSVVSQGDTLLIRLSPVFNEWKSVRVIRDNKVIYKGKGLDIYAMMIMGVFFIMTLYSFQLYFRMRKNRIAGSLVFIVIILVELIPLAIIFQMKG